MRVLKHILIPDRLRRPPRDGFSWTDRRFMHSFAPELGRDATFLYLFLCSVSDKRGLSYYKDETIADRMGIDAGAVRQSRQELIYRDLIAHNAPLYQVLSLPVRQTQCGGPMRIGHLLHSLAASSQKGGGA